MTFATDIDFGQGANKIQMLPINISCRYVTDALVILVPSMIDIYVYKHSVFTYNLPPRTFSETTGGHETGSCWI